jgi:DNA polymerase-3 subunit gamma/tau
MSYQALYRVYRPQTFAAVVGQETIARTLVNALRQGRLAHAYLFCGPRGTGKTSTSKILAKAVNCLDPQDGEPCNHCENCRAINEDRFMDVVEIDAASNRGIDEMRSIREQVRFAPAVGKRKVYIIDEVHMLTTEAFNALLKTLEEPPDHVLFILATTDPQKIPPTVLSRTQRFDFRRITPRAIADHLGDICRAESIQAEAAALDLIAANAAGGMRDAVSLLDQTIAFAGSAITVQDVTAVTGGISEEDLLALDQALVDGDHAGLLQKLSDLFSAGADARALAAGTTRHARALLLCRAGAEPADSPASPALRDMSRRFSLAQLEALMHRAADCERNLRLAVDAELETEMLFVDMMLTLHPQPTPQLSAPAPAPAPEPKASAAPAAPPAPAPASPASAPAQRPAPSSPSQPEAVVPPPAPAGSPLDQVQRLWPQILEALKGESMRLHAFMLPAQVTGFADGLLTITYPHDYAFHYKQMRMDKNKDALQEVIARFLDQPFKLSIEREPAPQEAAPAFSLEESARSVFGQDAPIVHVDE